LAPKNFLGGRPTKILDRIYKIKHTSDHGAKFCGNQPTELIDPVAKKKKENKCQQN